MAIPWRILFFEESRSRGMANLHSSRFEEDEIYSLGSSGNFKEWFIVKLRVLMRITNQTTIIDQILFDLAVCSQILLSLNTLASIILCFHLQTSMHHLIHQFSSRGLKGVCQRLPEKQIQNKFKTKFKQILSKFKTNSKQIQNKFKSSSNQIQNKFITNSEIWTKKLSKY